MYKMSVKNCALAAMALVAVACSPVCAGKGNPGVWVSIPLPGGAEWQGSFGAALNDTGLVAGGSVELCNGGIDAYPVYWDCSVDWECHEYFYLVAECGAPEGWEDANGYVTAVNNRGLMGGGLWFGMNEIAVLWDVNRRSVENLHPEGAFASEVKDVNEPGDACGFTVHVDEAGLYFRGHFWSRHGDKDAVLPPLDGFRNSWAWGVNASGAVCGVTYAPGMGHAVIWKDGEIIDIHPDVVALDDNVDRTWAYDIDENGTVVGRAKINDPEAGVLLLPFRWSRQHGAMFLDNGGRRDSVARRTADDVIVGRIGQWSLDGAQDAAVWVHGVLEILPDVPGFPVAEGYAINRAGVATGESYPDAGGPPYVQGWIAKKVKP